MRLRGTAWTLLGWWLCATAGAAEAMECRQDSLSITSIPVKNMARLVEEYRPLADLLSEGLGMPVRILHASSYEGVVDALVSGGVDLARLGPASYLQAWKLNPQIEPFVSLVPVKSDFFAGRGFYRSLLIVRRDSGLNSLASLRGRRVALSDPASTSGALIPRSVFAAEVGAPLGRYFASGVYAGSHDRALDAVLSGRVDAAFVSSESVNEYLAQGLSDKKALRVLWRSEPIHYDPLVFSATVCDELKQRIRSLLTTASPELDAFIASQRAEAIVPVDHQAYQAWLPILTD